MDVAHGVYLGGVPDAIRTASRSTPAKSLSGACVYEGDVPVSVMTVEGIEADMAAIRKAMARPRKNAEGPFWAEAQNYYWGRRGTLHDWQATLDELGGRLLAAIAYEADTSRILRASRFDAIKDRRDASLQALKRVIAEAMSHRPETAEGLLVQAQAMQAVALLDPWQKATAAITTEWGQAFAASLIRIASQA